MKLEELKIPLVPRSMCDCLDLGVKFYGRHLFQVLKLWFWVAAPTALLIYPMIYFGWGHLGHALLLVFFVSGPWSVLLVQKTVQTSFGEDFSSYPNNASELKSLFLLSLKALGVRLLTMLGAVLLIIPGWLIAVRSSFFIEKEGLSYWRGSSQDRGTGRLVKQEMGALFSRSFGIWCYTILYGICLFLTLDFLVESLFHLSIFSGKAFNEDVFYYGSSSEYGVFGDWVTLIGTDPTIVTLLSAVFLLVYPIGRFAWYFSYIDLRVRGDFWDLELRFQKEVERLQEASV